MRNAFFPVVICVLLIAALRPEGTSPAWTDMQYDLYRGEISSLVNQSQLTAIEKALAVFDPAKYKDLKIRLIVNAPNGRVADQIAALMRARLLAAGAILPGPAKEGEAEPVYDATLELDSVSGGFHRRSGLIRQRVESTVRLILFETGKDGKTASRDSGFRKAGMAVPGLSPEIRLVVLVLILGSIWVVAGMLYRLNQRRG